MKTAPLALILALAASPAAFAPSAALAQAMTPPEYVMAAGASDLFERQSSMIVLQTTTDPKVKAFAQEMIRDHGKSTEKVKTAAMKVGLPDTPPMLTPMQTELIGELRSEQGPARDALYIAQQKAAHNQALDVQKAYASDGTAAPLRMAATAIVPVVEHHIMMLKSM